MSGFPRFGGRCSCQCYLFCVGGSIGTGCRDRREKEEDEHCQLSSVITGLRCDVPPEVSSCMEWGAVPAWMEGCLGPIRTSWAWVSGYFLLRTVNHNMILSWPMYWEATRLIHLQTSVDSRGKKANGITEKKEDKIFHFFSVYCYFLSLISSKFFVHDPVLTLRMGWHDT